MQVDENSQNHQNGPSNNHTENNSKPRHSNIQVSTLKEKIDKLEALNKYSSNEINFFQRSLPAYARVKQSRVPNAYDKTALRLEVKEKVQ